MPPDIQYARSGDVSIAYLVIGDAPLDLVFVHGFVGHLEIEQESPEFRRMLDRFAARMHPPARAYLARKQSEGKSRREALRCLKRQLARTVYTTLRNEPLLT